VWKEVYTRTRYTRKEGYTRGVYKEREETKEVYTRREREREETKEVYTRTRYTRKEGYTRGVYEEREETKEVYTRRPARYLCLINSSALRRQICQKRPVHVKRDLFM